MNVCDVYNIDPANLKRIEDLLNSGLIELRQDRWNCGKSQFFCVPGKAISPPDTRIPDPNTTAR